MRCLLDLLAPSLCDGCDVRASPPWCDDCDAVARASRPDVPCAWCAGEAGPGHACWSGTPPVDGLVALTRWHDPMARAVLRAKLEGRREVMVALGRRLAPLVAPPPGGGDGPSPVAVVAVPTVPRRSRQRGADHTRALARGLAVELGVPVVAGLRTGRAAGDDRGVVTAAGRAALPHDAIVPAVGAARIRGARVVLVDDLVTTGGTLAASARALADSGVAGVHAAVVARAGRHQLHG